MSEGRTQALVVGGAEVIRLAGGAVEGAEGDGVGELVPEAHLGSPAHVGHDEGDEVGGRPREGQELRPRVHLDNPLTSSPVT